MFVCGLWLEHCAVGCGPGDGGRGGIPVWESEWSHDQHKITFTFAYDLIMMARAMMMMVMMENTQKFSLFQVQAGM